MVTGTTSRNTLFISTSTVFHSVAIKAFMSCKLNVCNQSTVPCNTSVDYYCSTFAGWYNVRRKHMQHLNDHDLFGSACENFLSVAVTN